MSRRKAAVESSEPPPRRGNPAIIPSQNVPDSPRETVVVAALPDPPAFTAPGAPSPQRESPLNIDEVVLNILREEMEELGSRLERFGIKLDAGMQQEMIDHTFAVLGGFVQGGTLAVR